MALHLGLIILKNTSKSLLELALEYYVGRIIKKNNKYLTHHIEQICTAESIIECKDTYAARVAGYCTAEEALHKINESDARLAKNIKELIEELHKVECADGDFIVVDVDPDDKLDKPDDKLDKPDNIIIDIPGNTALDTISIATSEKNNTCIIC